MGNEQIPVKREYGKVNADVAVGEDIGIELKRDLTNSNKHRLSGQITDYQKEFPYVIVVACGISDMDGWRELQNDYGGMGGIGMNRLRYTSFTSGRNTSEKTHPTSKTTKVDSSVVEVYFRCQVPVLREGFLTGLSIFSSWYS